MLSLKSWRFFLVLKYTPKIMGYNSIREIVSIFVDTITNIYYSATKKILPLISYDYF